MRQLRSAGHVDERATSLGSIGGGGVVVVGITDGALEGSSDASGGGEEVFLASFSEAGERQWVRQLGSSSNERAFDVVVDGDGAIYVAGYTQGDLPAAVEANAGGPGDAFVARYEATGDLDWIRLLGSAEQDGAYGIAVDGAGGVFVVGATDGVLPGSAGSGAIRPGVFVAKLTTRGDQVWLRQFDAPAGGAFGVAADGHGGLYVGGHGRGRPTESIDLGTESADVFVMRLSSDGETQWTQRLATDQEEYTSTIAADPSGGVLVAGNTFGTLPGAVPNRGGSDAFVAKFGADGSVPWVAQLGTSDLDDAEDVVVDDQGLAHVVGRTNGHLRQSQASNSGGFDAFTATIDGRGQVDSVRQFGTSESDGATAVAAGPGGAIYVAGFANATMPDSSDQHAGGEDAFVTRVPVPCQVALARRG
jgi:hypothetical protein